MSVNANVYISKIMFMEIKLEVRIYATYTTCPTLKTKIHPVKASMGQSNGCKASPCSLFTNIHIK